MGAMTTLKIFYGAFRKFFRGGYLICLKYSVVSIGIVCMGILLVSCEADQNQAVQTKGTEKLSPSQISSKISNMQERLQKLLEPIQYRYIPKGKYDIFQPFIKAAIQQNQTTVGPQACASVLECMDVGQLTLVAIVKRADKTYMAMVQDAAGVGYPIWLGTKIGYKNGVVADIRDDRVIIKEEGQDVRGRNIPVERVLFLHPEGK